MENRIRAVSLTTDEVSLGSTFVFWKFLVLISSGRLDVLTDILRGFPRHIQTNVDYSE
jgi:hypothetical protein